MNSWQEYLKNKTVTVMGLGVLGRGVQDALFLAKYVKKVIVTDLKKEDELKESIEKLKDFENIVFHLGEHREEDFTDVDFILKNAAVPKDSPYLALARQASVPIEMDEALFAKLVDKKIDLVGITGTRGKTSTSYLIYDFLQKLNRPVYLAGNIQGKATLPLLEIIEDNAIVVLELSSWQLQGFGEARISPHIAVWTNLYPDHLNYYKGSMEDYINDKKQIYKYQNIDDYFIYNANDPVLLDLLNEVPSQKIAFSADDYKDIYSINLKGEHNWENVSASIKVAELFNLDKESIQSVLDDFNGVPYRLELVKTLDNIEFYNDTTSTTPIAGLKALESFQNDEEIYLIAGGADKNLDFEDWVDYLIARVKKLFLLKGSATEKIKVLLEKKEKNDIIFEEYDNLEKAVLDAYNLAKIENPHNKKIVLFSPASASFGLFKNEYDRGEQFNQIIKNLK